MGLFAIPAYGHLGLWVTRPLSWLDGLSLSEASGPFVADTDGVAGTPTVSPSLTIDGWVDSTQRIQNLSIWVYTDLWWLIWKQQP